MAKRATRKIFVPHYPVMLQEYLKNSTRLQPALYWEVTVETDFTSANPGASSKEIRAIVKKRKKQLRKALLPYTKPESETGHENLMVHENNHFDYDKHHGELKFLSFPHLCVQDEKEKADDKKKGASEEQGFLPLCVELRNTNSAGRSGFYLNDISHTEGTGILCELETAVKYAIEDKTDKIKKHAHDFAEWWLVLVDYISYMPISSPEFRNELESLRNSIDVLDPWSRIIVISSTKYPWHSDLYPVKSKAR